MLYTQPTSANAKFSHLRRRVHHFLMLLVGSLEERAYEGDLPDTGVSQTLIDRGSAGSAMLGYVAVTEMPGVGSLFFFCILLESLDGTTPTPIILVAAHDAFTMRQCALSVISRVYASPGYWQQLEVNDDAYAYDPLFSNLRAVPLPPLSTGLSSDRRDDGSSAGPAPIRARAVHSRSPAPRRPCAQCASSLDLFAAASTGGMGLMGLTGGASTWSILSTTTTNSTQQSTHSEPCDRLSGVWCCPRMRTQ